MKLSYREKLLLIAAFTLAAWRGIELLVWNSPIEPTWVGFSKEVLAERSPTATPRKRMALIETSTSVGTVGNCYWKIDYYTSPTQYQKTLWCEVLIIFGQEAPEL